MPTPTNPRGKPFTWSYSSLKQYMTCPYQYAAYRFYESHKDQQGVDAMRGETIHSALEKRLKGEAELPDWCNAYEPYVLPIERARDAGQLLSVEDEVAFDRDFNRVDWFSKQAWGRGKLDVMLIDGDRCTVADWKSGKIKDDPMQLRIFAALALMLFPNLTEFNCKFIWLKFGKITGEKLTLDEVKRSWDQTLELVQEVEDAWVNELWVGKPSGLCRGWCHVTDCQFNKGVRR